LFNKLEIFEDPKDESIEERRVNLLGLGDQKFQGRF
jgi:hypothetical protein